MILLNPAVAASEAVAVNQSRPATATLLDSPDLRLVTFRLLPGQTVPLHTSTSSVLLTVLRGEGMILGRDTQRAVVAGDTIAYEPNEPHGMQATTAEFHLLACITPRPGNRAPSRALD